MRLRTIMLLDKRLTNKVQIKHVVQNATKESELKIIFLQILIVPTSYHKILKGRITYTSNSSLYYLNTM